MGEERFYREWVGSSDLVTFRVEVEESDLLVSARRDLSAEAHEKLLELRSEIKGYAAQDGAFLGALEPVEVPPTAAAMIVDMARAAETYSVGPMAAVAGAVARHLGLALLTESDELVIENGGDIFLCSRKPRVVSLYAGEASPFSGKLRILVESRGEEMGVCTSSGTVGHSVSFGKADAVVAIADSATLADAAATAICNAIKSRADIEPAVEREKARGSLRGLLIVMGDRLGVWGDVELVK